MLPVLVVAFILSGAAGLIYESVWARYLGLFVGHSAYAQVIVLVIFMGGMALGALVVGKHSARIRHPLLWYAGIELLIGIAGFTFHETFQVATGAAYERWFPALTAAPALLTAVKWTLAGALIFAPSVLLGATFPLMTAGGLRLPGARPGWMLGILYFANSFGAAIGVLFAGFYLIGRFGLPGTLFAAGVLNFAVALIVMLAVRIQGAVREIRDEAVPAAERRPTELWRLLLVASFGTALASFIYEIAWIRMLSLVLGSATHSFELMLSAFIMGLALGALWIRTRADRIQDPVRALGIVQWIMGTLAIATLPLYIASFSWTATMLQSLVRTEETYLAFSIARYGISLLVMLPATFCAGITLPLITRALLSAGAGERAIGTVYGVNTMGAIAGVVLAALVLMPVMGLKALLMFGALLDIAIGWYLLVWAKRRREPEVPTLAERLDPQPAVPMPLVLITAGIVLGTGAFAHLDQRLLASGVYRHGQVPERDQFAMLFYRDGRTASVSVRRSAGDTLGALTLATNGKPDASLSADWRRPWSPGNPPVVLRSDMATQILLPIITLAHAPHARTAVNVGLGSGITTHVLLGSPHIEHLSTIEIEPEIHRAARLFRPMNDRLFSDPRSHLIVDDARTVLAAAPRKFDLILSEPSNPWVSGVAGLFTVEFYQRVREHLAPGGVFGQWLHLYEISDDLALTVLTAFDRVFPAYEIFLTSGADILLVGGPDGPLAAPDWSVVQLPGIAQDLARAVPLTPIALEGLRLTNRATLHPYLRMEGRANSDFYPVLDLGTERTRYLRQTADGLSALASDWPDLSAALAGRRRGFSDMPQAIISDIPRTGQQALAARLRAFRDTGGLTVAPGDPQLRAAAYRLRMLERVLRGNEPPPDWRLWLQAVSLVEADLHAGTTGVADDRFYGDLRRYVARVNAPAEVRAVVDFSHGLASWDWPEVVRAGNVLVAATRRGEAWIAATQLRQGIALAHLRLGNAEGARATYQLLAPFGEPQTFRDRLIGAQILYRSREDRPAVPAN